MGHRLHDLEDSHRHTKFNMIRHTNNRPTAMHSKVVWLKGIMMAPTGVVADEVQQQGAGIRSAGSMGSVASRAKRIRVKIPRDDVSLKLSIWEPLENRVGSGGWHSGLIVGTVISIVLS
jgi:hypothetical protein